MTLVVLLGHACDLSRVDGNVIESVGAGTLSDRFLHGGNMNGISFKCVPDSAGCIYLDASIRNEAINEIVRRSS